MGMSPLEFWSMSPILFELKAEGHFQQQNRAGIYFRESFALLYNVNRGEKNEALSGTDVLRLPGEKKPRKPRLPKGSVMRMSPDEIADLMRRMNAS